MACPPRRLLRQQPLGDLTPERALDLPPMARRTWRLHRRPPAALILAVGLPIDTATIEVAVIASAGSRGDSYDNALAESTFGQTKAELVHRRGPWRTVEQLEYALFE
jgi:transposase InsO family protein